VSIVRLSAVDCANARVGIIPRVCSRSCRRDRRSLRGRWIIPRLLDTRGGCRWTRSEGQRLRPQGKLKSRSVHYGQCQCRVFLLGRERPFRTCHASGIGGGIMSFHSFLMYFFCEACITEGNPYDPCPSRPHSGKRNTLRRKLTGAWQRRSSCRPSC
jgi:hypothetical protein